MTWTFFLSLSLSYNYLSFWPHRKAWSMANHRNTLTRFATPWIRSHAHFFFMLALLFLPPLFLSLFCVLILPPLFTIRSHQQHQFDSRYWAQTHVGPGQFSWIHKWRKRNDISSFETFENFSRKSGLKVFFCVWASLESILDWTGVNDRQEVALRAKIDKRNTIYMICNIKYYLYRCNCVIVIHLNIKY